MPSLLRFLGSLLDRLSPRTRGVMAMIGTSVLTSQVTAPVAASALAPPWQMPRLWGAIGVCMAAIALAGVVGRSVTREVAAERARRA